MLTSNTCDNAAFKTWVGAIALGKKEGMISTQPGYLPCGLVGVWLTRMYEGEDQRWLCEMLLRDVDC